MKLIFVQGPTAVGKSDLALRLAQEFSAAIVNCDSVQVYESLDIGSAKPAAQDMKKAPHFLYSYVPKGAKMTAGQYARDFYELLEKIKSQYSLIFVVGGTGFYFQALEKGMYPVLGVSQELRLKISQRLQSNPQDLYRELQERDPVYAQKISPQDHYRLGRAMEIIWGENKTVTQVKSEFENREKSLPYPLLKLGVHLSKPELQKRVEVRTQKMLNAGLIQEVQKLRQDGWGDWEALRSVGYKETMDFLDGRLGSQTDLEKIIIQGTMQLIKKQKTWFRRDNEIQWVEPDQYEISFQKVSLFQSEMNS